jgi:hypothetical protein
VLTLEPIGKDVNFDIPFSQIERDRDEFIAAFEINIDETDEQLKKRLTELTNSNFVRPSLHPQLHLLLGLQRLLRGRHVRNFESASGALLISLFMRIYRLGDERGKKELRKKWSGCTARPDIAIQTLFEMGIGAYYTFRGNCATYNDLANSDGQFDWKVSNQEMECSVEVKSTSWRTKTPMDDSTLHKVVEHILEFLTSEGVVGAHGMLRLIFSGQSQTQSRPRAIPDLSSLLASPRILNGISRKSGLWEAEFVQWDTPFANASRKALKNLELTPQFDGFELIFADSQGRGPICGISFAGKWDHGTAMLRNVEKALDQVAHQPCSVIWIQMSGMLARHNSPTADFAMLLRRDKRFEHGFHRLISRPKNNGFCALHLARDFDYILKSNALGIKIENSLFIPSERFENGNAYSQFIIGNKPSPLLPIFANNFP